MLIGSHLTPPPPSIVGSTGTLTAPVPTTPRSSLRTASAVDRCQYQRGQGSLLRRGASQGQDHRGVAQGQCGVPSVDQTGGRSLISGDRYSDSAAVPACLLGPISPHPWRQSWESTGTSTAPVPIGDSERHGRFLEGFPSDQNQAQVSFAASGAPILRDGLFDRTKDRGAGVVEHFDS